jgi:phosphoglycolate phosphatase-like HAD superfamily hydrolase/ADP-ribose pyrophosphatase YjhB (NUDIX family)
MNLFMATRFSSANGKCNCRRFENFPEVCSLDCQSANPRYTLFVIRNIIFDWSGTLVDDLPAVWEASNYVLTQAGQTAMTLDQFRAEFQLPFTTFYDKHTPHVPMSQLEDWFHTRFKQVQDSVSALPYARQFVEFTRANKLRAFLLSTVREDHFAVQQRASGFGDFLEKAYLGVWDKRQKIHEIIEVNRLQPDETLFIGDMQHDIETARHGGIHACAVLTGYNTLEQLRTAQPDLIVEHLGELRDILEQNELHLKPQVKRFEEAHPPIATVGGLIFNGAGEVLMIRTHKWSNLWGIPGGKIKWGEPSEAALRREIKEETNLDITGIRFVLVQDCIHSKEFYRDAHFVLLNYTCHCAGRDEVKLNDEAREFRWVELDAALQMPINAPTRILLEAVVGGTARGHPGRSTPGNVAMRRNRKSDSVVRAAGGTPARRPRSKDQS